MMRALVVGAGSIGTRHLRNLRELGVSQCALVEPVTERRLALARELNIDHFVDIGAGLSWRPDIAVIATPTNFHVEQALRAAQAGCHLFIEKPLAHSLDGVEILKSEVRRRGLVTMVGCDMRFHLGPRAVRRLLDEMAIGDVLAARIETGSYLPRWRPGQDYRASYSASPEFGGAILDCIHEIDLTLWYLGPARLIASAVLPATSLGLETDGLAELLFQHESGPISSVHLNFVQRDYRRCCQIIGSEGTLRWDFSAGKVTRWGSDGEPAQTIDQPSDWTVNQMYVDEMRHFLDAVESGQETMNPIEQAEETLKIALAARESKGMSQGSGVSVRSQR